MQTPPTLAANNDIHATVSQEFEAMLDRCEAAGITREVAQDKVYWMLANQVLIAADEERRAREAKAAQSPAGLALQAAFDLDRKNAKLSRHGINPDTSLFDTACQTYLLETYGVSVGDTVEVYGWTKPRTIRLTGFRLSFYNAEAASDGFLWFEGEGLRNCPRKRVDNSHGCLLGTRVHKV